MDNIESLAVVLQRFTTSESFFTPWHDRYKNTHYRAYRGVPDKSKYPYRNKVFDKITYTLVEVVTSRMMKTVFQSRPVISIIPQENSDSELAKGLEKVIANLLEDPEAEFFVELTDWFKQCATAGSGYLKISPNFSYNEETKELDFDGFRFEMVDYMNGFPDPCAKRNSKGRFFIEKQLVDFDELKRMEAAGMFSNVDQIKGNYESFDVIAERLSTLGIGGQQSTYDPITGKVELLHHYADGEIITVAGRTTVIRDTAKEKGGPVMPYATPIIDVRYCAVPGEYMGIGVPEQLEQDQEYINLLRSATLDNIDIIVNKLFTLKINGATEARDVRSAPGQVIPIAEQGDLTELQMSDISQSVMYTLEGLDKKTQDTTGEYEYGRGATPTRKETATGIINLQEATLIRFDLTTKNFEFSGIRMIGQKAIEILYRFGSPELFERILGESGRAVADKFFAFPVKDLLKQYDVAPVGSTVTANKALLAEQAMQAYSVLSAVPPEVQQANGFKINLEKALKNVLKSINAKDADELVTKVEQPQQEPQALPQGGQSQQGANPLAQLMGGGGNA